VTELLLVTADPELRRFVKAALDGIPVRFQEDCNDAHRAMELFRDQRARYIILDLFLPESSGVEIIKTIKKLDDKVTFILLSRMTNRSLKERAFRSGADDILPYPCSSEMLKETMLHRLDNPKVEEIRFT
jgi:DNA-binding response OmpR family regulator